MQLSNYLFFTTSCEAALGFYTEYGLGRVVEWLRYGEAGMPVRNETMRGHIMHARFEGPGVLFYASDNDDAEPMRGSAHLLTMDSRAQTETLFGRLAQGGVITTPLGMQPWGAGRRAFSALSLSLSISASAYAAGPPALTLPLSTDAMRTAVRTCQAKGFKVAVTIVDPDGVIKLQARDDGSPIHSQGFSFRKAYTVVSMGPMFGLDTGTALVKFLSTYPSGMSNVGAGSTELLFVPGAVLIRSGNDVLGSIGVSGSPLSSDDERCAAAGAAEIQTALSSGSQ